MIDSRLIQMIERGRLPIRDGQWIDAYNQSTMPDYAGTICSSIDNKNHYFIMEVYEENQNAVGTDDKARQEGEDKDLHDR